MIRSLLGLTLTAALPAPDAASTPLHYQPGGLAVWKMEGGH
jgi:hypothetical protein